MKTHKSRPSSGGGSKKFRKSKCSPTTEIKEYTCYTSKALIRLRELWNARHPDVLIKSNHPNEIWSKLKTYMVDVCDSEACWLRQKFVDEKIKKELMSYTFAPHAPEEWKKKPKTWLNSLDISRVLKQYERSNPEFKFIGPSPIDFDKRKMYGQCVWEELCNFNLKKLLLKGKRKIGISFNLDPHNKGGSHWVSMFIDINKKTVVYFDSNGDKIKKQFKVLADRIINQAKQLDSPIILTFDEGYPTEHQQKDTECGVYSLYFIIESLTNRKSPEYFKKHVISDEEIHILRYKYFNFK